MQVVQHYQQLFEAYRKNHPFNGSPERLYDPVNYIMGLGGKRLRPAMALMGYGLFQDEVQPALPLAYAVEIFHNFTLVHDDIMDAAPLRRGKPTVHALYNANTAILSGDVMLISAYEYLMQVQPGEKLPQVLSIFNRVAREVCEGQQMDMDFESRRDVTIPEYLRMIELKTAVLIAGCLAIGAAAAGALPADIDRLYQFGRWSGVAFQLQDDILDTFGNPEKVGKKIGGDIAQNKKTFLILKALEIAPEPERKRIQELMSDKVTDEATKINEVTSLLTQLGIQEKAAQEKNRFRQMAMKALGEIQCPEARKTPLRELAEALIDREF